MRDLGLMRFYFVLLAIFTVGRWALGFGGANYDATHQVFSLVILTFLSSLFYGFIVRRFLNDGIKRAIVIGITLAVVSQTVILTSTLLSYLAGIETFWNTPRALNVKEAIPLGQAMAARAGGLVANSVLNAIMASIGWAIAAVVPKQAD